MSDPDRAHLDQTKFYRRVMVVEVLSDVDPSQWQLETLVEGITDGSACEAILADSTEEVDGDVMRGLLIAQGSDPSFLLGENHDEDMESAGVAPPKPYQINHLGVMKDYDYSATHKRERLTLWTGPFASVMEGEAYSLRSGDGYMITTHPNGAKIRVTCPTPREEDNYEEIDEALRVALNRYYVALNRYYEASGIGALDVATDQKAGPAMSKRILIKAEDKDSVVSAMAATGLPYPGLTATYGDVYVAEAEGAVLDAALSAGAMAIPE